MKLLFDNMYVFLHIGKVRIPSCLEELNDYLTDLDVMLTVSELFISSYEKKLPRPERTYKANVNSEVKLEDVLSASQSGRRKCTLTF